MTRWLLSKRTILKGTFKAILLLAFALCVLQLFSVTSYKVSDGTLSYELDRSNSFSGQVEVSLGPAGYLRFNTHKTPINIKANYVLDSEDNQSAGELIDKIDTIQPDAISTLKKFVVSRIPWIILIGAICGVLLTNGGGAWYRKAAKNGVIGIAGSLVVTSIIVLVTVFSFDRTPKIEYEGIAENIPKVTNLIQKFSKGSSEETTGIENFIKGIETASLQVDEAAASDSNERIRILCVSDVHDNIIGARMANSIIESEEFGEISLLVLLGDITNFGSGREAKIFTHQIRQDKAAIYFVGGNHEDLPAMEVFKEAGYKEIDGFESYFEGISIFGKSDPVAYSEAVVPREEESVLADASEDLFASWEKLSDKPDLILVHNLRQAEAIIDTAEKEKLDMAVVYGHDHKAKLEKVEKTLLVDVGTSGASGFEDIGYDPTSPYTFQILEFSKASDPVLLAVTTLTFRGVAGKTTIEYTPVN